LVTIRIITPGDTGNIRLAQIVSPDGETDGPFGKAYTDSLQVPGVYRIIVAENLMQESLYQGTYTVRVDMQKSRADQVGAFPLGVASRSSTERTIKIIAY